MDLNIRNALIEDVDSISKIHVNSWVSTYKGILPEKTLAELSVEERVEMWKKIVTEAETKILVYDHNNIGILGWISYGNARDDIKYKGVVGEIKAIYIDPNYIRCGYGKLLFQKSIIDFKKMGFTRVYLWVLSENIMAKNFYQRLGMICDINYKNEITYENINFQEEMYYLDI
ncbi:GNAT family N-acetyltransferase [Acinetobacter sp. Tr-809]|nr:GNAT family N-acetyltransferase [Acinetobacter sp. Tr-809]